MKTLKIKYKNTSVKRHFSGHALFMAAILSLSFSFVSLSYAEAKEGGKAHHGGHDHSTHSHEAPKADPSAVDSQKAEQNYDVVVNVNGMVCSFCVNNIEKRFKKEKAIKDVKVNLDVKKVFLSFKDKSTLSDDQITANIKKAGYNVVSIQRK